jgi:ATP-dependent DNA helicase RecG
MSMVAQIGSGINRMKDLMQAGKLTPPEFSTDGIFTVTSKRPFDFDKWVNIG